MTSQRGLLRLHRRMQVVKIEAAFPDGDHLLRSRQLAQRADPIRVAILRVVRMHSDDREDMRMPRGDFDRAPIRLEGGNRAYRDNRAEARFRRPPQNPVEVRLELGIGEMAVGVDDRVHLRKVTMRFILTDNLLQEFDRRSNWQSVYIAFLLPNGKPRVMRPGGSTRRPSPVPMVRRHASSRPNGSR